MTDVFEAQSIDPEVSLMARTATVPDPEYGQIAVLELQIENEAEGVGETVRLHPDDAFEFQSFMSNIDAKLDGEQRPDFEDFGPRGP